MRTDWPSEPLRGPPQPGLHLGGNFSGNYGVCSILHYLKVNWEISIETNKYKLINIEMLSIELLKIQIISAKFILNVVTETCIYLKKAL